MGFTGIQAEMKRLRDEVKKLEQEAIAEVKIAALKAVNVMFPITPVNTGETVANYAVGVGSPNRTYRAPAGQQPPAPTNKLALGSEPNRAANEAIARQQIDIALAGMKKLTTVWVTNNVSGDKWGLIESGNAPGAPFMNRGPGGQSSLAEAAVRNGSGGKWK